MFLKAEVNKLERKILRIKKQLKVLDLQTLILASRNIQRKRINLAFGA